jgi:hypothetical protein
MKFHHQLNIPEHSLLCAHRTSSRAGSSDFGHGRPMLPLCLKLLAPQKQETAMKTVIAALLTLGMVASITMTTLGHAHAAPDPPELTTVTGNAAG